jgi:DNA polymerase III epsilon subunit-like protein
VDELPAECLISVDVEAAGPAPSSYALLAIGACLVDDPDRQFSVELQPTHLAETAEAAAVHGLSLERLRVEGVPPERAMAQFDTWVRESAGAGQRPVFVGFNAAFDWMFVADYFHRFVGHNPFGHAPLDIKSYYMGAADVTFGATSRRWLAERYPDLPDLAHDALQDAVDQAHLFRRIRTDPRLRGAPHG